MLFHRVILKSIDSGYRIPGVIALSANQAGIQLKTLEDLIEGNAISADFTAEGWHGHLGYINTPSTKPCSGWGTLK